MTIPPAETDGTTPADDGDRLRDSAVLFGRKCAPPAVGDGLRERS